MVCFQSLTVTTVVYGAVMKLTCSKSQSHQGTNQSRESQELHGEDDAVKNTQGDMMLSYKRSWDTQTTDNVDIMS